MQDPEVYLRNHDLNVPCAVAPANRAVLDSSHRRYVNWEVFFVSDFERGAEFDSDPVRYCGVVTDPVTHQRFRPRANSPRYDFNGRPYYFVSDSTRAIFAAYPDTLANPNYRMARMSKGRGQ